MWLMRNCAYSAIGKTNNNYSMIGASLESQLFRHIRVLDKF